MILLFRRRCAQCCLRGGRWNLVDEAAKNCRREIGPMKDRDHIVKFCELTFDLLEFWFVSHVQENSARRFVRKRDHDDGFKIEGPTRKQSSDVGHRSWMVAHHEFQDDRGRVDAFVI